MKKRIMSLLLALVVLVGMVNPVLATETNEKVDSLVSRGWVVGRGGEGLDLDKTITRAELTKMLSLVDMRINGTELDPEGYNDFVDVADDHWAKSYIDYASKRKLITGYEDKTFCPEDNISYVEAMTILSRMHPAFNKEEEAAGDYWGDTYIEFSKRYDVLKDVEYYDSYYSQDILRENAFEMIYNLVESIEKYNYENVKTYNISRRYEGKIPALDKFFNLVYIEDLKATVGTEYFKDKDLLEVMNKGQMYYISKAELDLSRPIREVGVEIYKDDVMMDEINFTIKNGFAKERFIVSADKRAMGVNLIEVLGAYKDKGFIDPLIDKVTPRGTFEDRMADVVKAFISTNLEYNSLASKNEDLKLGKANDRMAVSIFADLLNEANIEYRSVASYNDKKDIVILTLEVKDDDGNWKVLNPRHYMDLARKDIKKEDLKDLDKVYEKHFKGQLGEIVTYFEVEENAKADSWQTIYRSPSIKDGRVVGDHMEIVEYPLYR